MRESMIPVALVKRAREIVLAQRAVPMSPAAYTSEGDIVLCAAACLAYAGLERRDGPIAAVSWAHALARCGSTRELVEAFTELGWDVEMCREKIDFNDRMPADARQQEVASMFHLWGRDLDLAQPTPRATI